MTEEAESDELLEQCHGVGLTRTSLVEVQDGSIVVSVRLSLIQRLTVRHGVASERPAALVVIGLALSAVAAWALFLATVDLFAGEHPPKFEMLLVTAGPFGALVLHLALRKRSYLLAETRGDVRKLPFGAGVTRAELEGFLESLQPKLRCPISNQLPR